MQTATKGAVYILHVTMQAAKSNVLFELAHMNMHMYEVVI